MSVPRGTFDPAEPCENAECDCHAYNAGEFRAVAALVLHHMRVEGGKARQRQRTAAERSESGKIMNEKLRGRK